MRLLSRNCGLPATPKSGGSLNDAVAEPVRLICRLCLMQTDREHAEEERPRGEGALCPVRLVREHRADYRSLTAAGAAVAKQERLGRETVPGARVQAEIDAGDRPGPTTQETEDASPTSSTPPPDGSTGGNHDRLHGSLGLVSSVQCDQTRYASRNPVDSPT